MDRKVINGVELTKGEDGLWRDREGTIFGLAEDDADADPIVRCGVGVASLPVSDEWTPGCAPHDFAYSSPAYQRFHDRSEADEMLEDHLKFVSTSRWRRALAPAAALAARIAGWPFWEWARTRFR